MVATYYLHASQQHRMTETNLHPPISIDISDLLTAGRAFVLFFRGMGVIEVLKEPFFCKFLLAPFAHCVYSDLSRSILVCV